MTLRNSGGTGGGAQEPYAEAIQSGEKRDELRITAWADKRSGAMKPVKQYDGISEHRVESF